MQTSDVTDPLPRPLFVSSLMKNKTKKKISVRKDTIRTYVQMYITPPNLNLYLTK